MAQFGRHIPVIAHVTVETTGTMLLGSEIGAALTAVEPLGVDMIGLNCATGPAEMSEHLRYLSQHARTPVSVMPNAGLPVLGANGAEYPLQPDELAEALSGFVTDYGLSLVGGCCGTTPEHIRRVAEAIPGVQRAERHITYEPAVASLYSSTPFAQDASVLMIGERTNANGSKAFREAMIAEDWQKCLDIAKEQTRDGAHLLDLCVDYVGRDGVADMNALASRLATASTLPIMLDSTETPVLRGGFGAPRWPVRDQLGELRGRRRPGVAIPQDHGARRRARRRRGRADHRRGGPGPHRREEGGDRRAADRRHHRQLGRRRVVDPDRHA